MRRLLIVRVEEDAEGAERLRAALTAGDEKVVAQIAGNRLDRARGRS